jgi:hypothetical protein
MNVERQARGAFVSADLSIISTSLGDLCVPGSVDLV